MQNQYYKINKREVIFMAFCPKCGTQVAAETRFCPSCGAEVEAAAASSAPNNAQTTGTQGNQSKGFFDTPDTTAEFDAKDIADNKIMGILSYFGLLVLVPIFAAPTSKFAKYHANQGVVLCIVMVAYSILSGILTAIIRVPTTYSVWGISYTDYGAPGWLTAILGLLWLPLGVLAILGIINAANGKCKELPIIGKFKILK